MRRIALMSAVLTGALCLGTDNRAQAQWAFPGGFGMCGWGGWGATTAEGDLARGLGMFAQGAGVYNRQTAEANAINKDTLMRWNQYVYEAQKNANRKRAQITAADRARTTELNDARLKRLRDNPEARDIHRGAALNVALDEIDDPRVYVKALQAAKAKIGGDLIRNIPFKYAPAAFTYSISELARGPMPAALTRPDFAGHREAISRLGSRIDSQIEEDRGPDPETVKQLFTAIHAAEDQVAKSLERNSRERNEAERYLKALHGLAGMLKTPAIEVILAGVDKRPEATLGELLSFMTAFNLRFGAASTPQQREVYNQLYPQLVALRDQIAPALATSTPPAKPADISAATDFFSGMSIEDLRKQSPKP